MTLSNQTSRCICKCIRMSVVSAVILMEGGTEEDLAILEEPEQDDGQRSRTTSETADKT